jgi:hypothetical protein
MPGLDPGIHVLAVCSKKDVDGRVKPGHDEESYLARCITGFSTGFLASLRLCAVLINAI